MFLYLHRSIHAADCVIDEQRILFPKAGYLTVFELISLFSSQENSLCIWQVCVSSEAKD